ncbi:uncharacterized protein PV07_04169 [Cladophialophora immunda]|uniref:Zn(2)-C6 fungal-type domain-containing protein n=1 Tax=Cladophialophora immunda TaxID=569365 RepID=A0A0D2DAA7_9EURO|nr:uncharacterized protein PV07_04169 [Cladophialophora immunda]KIW32639.1 hypothetical protein PV07_04169 [Cladophialophora immunda]OQV03573.1 Fungal specific transcription factor domain-containing protein [Cladophialophora immunda]
MYKCSPLQPHRSPEPAWESFTPPMLGDSLRKRAKTACRPCRERKRKCEGGIPCSACRHFEYHCVFDRPLRPNSHSGQVLNHGTRSSVSSPTTDNDQPRHIRDQQIAPLQTEQSQLRSLQANSGAVFARTLGLTADSTRVRRLQLSAWNLGLRDEATASGLGPRPIVEILSLSEMEVLTAVYFQDVHSVYGFLDEDSIRRQIATRWRESATPRSHDCVESILCGIAALGCLFSKQPLSLELQLQKSAEAALGQSVLLPTPSTDDVVAWLLRVIYLRLTASPHITWMATCTMMHVLEAARLHFDEGDEPSPSGNGAEGGGESRRRIYMVAQLFNIWISFDCGRSRVELRGASCLLPTPDADGIKPELLELYLVSEILSPDKYQTVPELETLLRRALDVKSAQPMLVLVQCNVMLCIYRRLRVQGSSPNTETLERMLSALSMAVDAALVLLRTEHPWWHVANVTFQAACALLAIDTSLSLAQLIQPLKALQKVSAHYQTAATREAYEAARVLVGVHRKRKELDIARLDGVLQECQPHNASDCNDTELEGHGDQWHSSIPASLGMNKFGLGELEWEQFFNLDIP